MTKKRLTEMPKGNPEGECQVSRNVVKVCVLSHAGTRKDLTIDGLSSEMVFGKYFVVFGGGFPVPDDFESLGNYLKLVQFVRKASGVVALGESKSRAISSMHQSVFLAKEDTSLASAGKMLGRTTGGNSKALMIGCTERQELIILDVLRESSSEAGADALQKWSTRSALVVDPPQCGVALYDLTADRLIWVSGGHVAHRPASVTKLLTLMLIQQRIVEAEVGLDTPVPVSSGAVATASWWGIRAGDRVALGELIRATAIVSCNEAANALAEWHSGSRAAFTVRLNAFARKIGLTNTLLSSPSGLGARQMTTAHDMVKLGRYVLLHSSSYLKDVFCERSFSYGEKRGVATNKLLGQVAGASGLKTGRLIDSSKPLRGINNLLFSAARGDRELLAVVLGAPTPDARDLISETLVEIGFSPFGEA